MPREIVKLECTSCKGYIVSMTKNKKKHTARMEVTKYCPKERKRVLFRESK